MEFAARSGEMERHRGYMGGTYVGGLIIAGAFTLMPGRRMHDVIFGPDVGAVPALIVVAAAFLAAGIIMARMVVMPRRRGVTAVIED